MPHPIHDRLRELETDVQSLTFLPAAAVRAHGRRRGRRQLATAAVALLILATGVGFTTTRDWGRPGGTVPAATGLSCSVAIPSDPVDVTVRMVDGGASAAVIDATDTKLRNRRFTVVNPKVGRTSERINGTATLHYGPGAIGAATLVRAYLRGDTTMWFDPDRRDDAVDLLLGRTFAGLVTVTEVNQALVAAGEPSAPFGCAPSAPTTPSR